jgi:hypothetical protein
MKPYEPVYIRKTEPLQPFVRDDGMVSPGVKLPRPLPDTKKITQPALSGRKPVSGMGVSKRVAHTGHLR